MVLTEKPEPQKTVKVAVNPPFRVVDPDTHEAHTSGEISVPQDVADEWAKSGWVTPATKAK